MIESVLLQLGNVEITSSELVLHSFEEKTVIPLNEIKNYRLEWHLHDPLFAKKWWFLVLTVKLKNGDDESGHVTSVKFSYLSDQREQRERIERKIADALDAALAKTPDTRQKMHGV